MNISELVKHIAEKEGGKSNVKIGDIREMVGILSDLFYKEVMSLPNAKGSTLESLFKNGKRRAKKKKDGKRV